MSGDAIFGLVICGSMLIGLVWNFNLAYRIVKYCKKEHPDAKYTYENVWNQQYQLGGPLVLIPFAGICFTILFEFMFYFNKKKMQNPFSKFLDKEI